MTRAVLLLCIMLTGAIMPRSAQAQGDLRSEVDSLVDSGDHDAARTLLDRWRSERSLESGLTPADRTHLIFLRARLSTDPLDAEDDLLTLILGYPEAPETPGALLYLGQGLLARGDYLRAASYLERLSRDYPGNPSHSIGLLWLARVQLEAERPTEACQTAMQARTKASEADLVDLIERVEGEACALAGNETDREYGTLEVEERRGSTKRDEATRAGFTVQAGAFSRSEGARALADRLREAGFDSRVILLPGSTLKHVRVGTYSEAATAAAAARAMREQGFEAVVVSDTMSERRSS